MMRVYNPPHQQRSISTTTTRLFSTTRSDEDTIENLEVLITNKGNEIRTMKEQGISKIELGPHVEELKLLKSKLSNMNGGEVASPQTTATTTMKKKVTKNKNDNNNNNNINNDDDNNAMSINELRESRLAKVAAMRAMDVEPYAYSYKPNITAMEI